MLAMLMLNSCMTKESKFLKNAEKYCINQLDNPKSYSLVSISITDTLTAKQELINLRQCYISRVESYLRSDSAAIKYGKYGKPGEILSGYEIDRYNAAYNAAVVEIPKLEKELIIEKESLNETLKEKDNKVIVKIYISITFRASNKFGAIVKNDTYITYTPTHGFEMGKEN